VCVMEPLADDALEPPSVSQATQLSCPSIDAAHTYGLSIRAGSGTGNRILQGDARPVDPRDNVTAGSPASD
jgi:hypothetical protein